LRTLEDRIRPPFLARAWPRDLLGVALLVGLAVVLAPAMRVDFSGAGGAIEGAQGPLGAEPPTGALIQGLTGAMTSIYLLLALGLLLCLRCGAIDASVWVVSAVGGLVAAGCIKAGMATLPAVLLGVGAGAAVGAVNGLLVAFARLPSIAVTVATGLALMWATQAVCPQGRQIELPEYSFAGWQISLGESQPLVLTRMLIVGGLYSLVMLVLLAFDWFVRRPPSPGSRPVLLAAMAVSGALAAAAGALWLMEHNAAPVPTRLVDDLKAPAAAVLAGAAFLAGRGRGLLAGVFLPAALLLAGVWKLEVLNFQRWGYSLQLVLLGCMVLVVQQAGRDFTAGRWARQRMPLIGALVGTAGIVVFAAAANQASLYPRRMFQLGGLLIWLLSAALIVIYRAGPKGKAMT